MAADIIQIRDYMTMEERLKRWTRVVDSDTRTLEQQAIEIMNVAVVEDSEETDPA